MRNAIIRRDGHVAFNIDCARARYGGYGHDFLMGYSSKARRICFLSNTLRMADKELAKKPRATAT